MNRIAIYFALAISAVFFFNSQAAISQRPAQQVSDAYEDNSLKYNLSYSCCWYDDGYSHSRSIFEEIDAGKPIDKKVRYVFDCAAEKFDLENDIRLVTIRFSFTDGENPQGYFVREFVDSARQSALAVEFGSLNSGFVRENVRKSFYFRLDAAIDYAAFARAKNITSKLLFTKPDGSYAYEISNSGALCGLRYYSARNQKEYFLLIK